MVSFPGSIPSLARPSSSTAMNATGYEGDVVIDAISDEVEAIATELGTDPAGAQATVKARLDVVDVARAEHSYWPAAETLLTSRTPATGSTVTLGVNTLNYFPWWCPKGVTLDRISVEVTTLQSAANARVGIYADSGGNPGSLISDCGEVDCSANGVKTLTISQALTAGPYWLAIWNETASVAYRSSPNSSARAIGIVDGTTQQAAYSRLVETVTYSGGLPSTPGTLSGGGGGSGAAMFWLRRT